MRINEWICKHVCSFIYMYRFPPVRMAVNGTEMIYTRLSKEVKKLMRKKVYLYTYIFIYVYMVVFVNIHMYMYLYTYTTLCLFIILIGEGV
jgi:Na+-translocating ferredoxin:NAD+ oxidoreductase RnfE subunit